MQKIISILFALSVIFCGANVDAKTTKKSTGKKKTSTSSSQGIKKGAINTYGDYLKTQTFTVDKGNNGKIVVEYPISGDPQLVKSLRNYIRDILSISNQKIYTGSLENPDGLLRSAMKGMRGGFHFSADIKVIYSTPKLITFETTVDEYEFDSHGMYWNMSATFIVENGQHLDISMLPDFDKMQDYILEALARERETTVYELSQRFWNEDSLTNYGVVYITEDGLNVHYQPYDLADYMTGSFHGVIPIKEVYDILPEKTRRLLE